MAISTVALVFTGLTYLDRRRERPDAHVANVTVESTHPDSVGGIIRGDGLREIVIRNDAPTSVTLIGAGVINGHRFVYGKQLDLVRSWRVRYADTNSLVSRVVASGTCCPVRSGAEEGSIAALPNHALAGR